MIFFLICIGYIAHLDEEVFYTEQSLKVYARHARGWTLNDWANAPFDYQGLDAITVDPECPPGKMYIMQSGPLTKKRREGILRDVASTD